MITGHITNWRKSTETFQWTLPISRRRCLLWGAVDLTAPSCRNAFPAAATSQPARAVVRCFMLRDPTASAEFNLTAERNATERRARPGRNRSTGFMSKSGNECRLIRLLWHLLSRLDPMSRSDWMSWKELSGFLGRGGGPCSCSCCWSLCAALIPAFIVFSQILSQIAFFLFTSKL